MKNKKYFIKFFLLLLFTLGGIESKGAIVKNQVDSLYQVGIQHIRSNPDSVFLIAKKIYAEGLANQNDYDKRKGKLLAAFYYLNTLKLDTAKVLLTELINFCENEKKYKISAENWEAWFYLGHTYLRGYKINDAVIASNKAIKVSEQLGNPTMLGNSFFLRGDIEYVQQKKSEALEFYIKAYKISKESNDHSIHMINITERIAEIYSLIGQNSSALVYLKEILNIENLKESKKSSILHSIGKSYMIIDQYDSAERYFHQSKVIARQSATGKFQLDYIDFSIANNLSRKGEFRKSNQILHPLLEHGLIHEKINLFGTLSHNYYGLAMYDSSIYFARIAYQISIKEGKSQSIISTSSVLFNSFEKRGQFDSALFYFKQHHQVQDSVFNLDNQKKISSLYAEVETLDKQLEIDTLGLENQLAISQARNMTILFWTGIFVSLLLVLVLILVFRMRRKALLLQKYELQSEIEQKIQDLSMQSARMIQKSNSLTDLEESLKKMKKGLVNGKAQEVQHMLNSIRVSKVVDKEWEKFDEYFGSTNQQFLEHLGLRFPELTVNEKRLATLVKNGFSNREVAELMNIEDKSVRMAKYRLKKRISIAEDIGLFKFLTKLSKEGLMAKK